MKHFPILILISLILVLMPNLRISSYNVRSVNTAVEEVHKRCQANDIVFLQEHWLTSEQLPVLNDIHGDRRHSDVFGGIWVLSPCSMEP